MARMVSSSIRAILATSCEVRNPSKKCRKGMRASRVDAWAIRPKSITSCTDPAARKAKPVARADITSEWSPKIDSAWVAKVRAVMLNTVEVSSPAILYMLGILSKRPWEAVNVVVRAPACSEPCTAPAAPPSLCISHTTGTLPQMFLMPFAAHSSAHSPMLDDGVIG